MTFQVKNQVSLSVQVNGNEMPIAEQSFQKFEMIENVQNKLPTIEFIYQDSSNFCQSAGLVGGAILSVNFNSNRAADPDQGYSVDYLVTGTHVQIQGNKEIWLVSGIYNAPKFLGGVVKGSRKGNSSDVISGLIGECGLTANATTTSDSMAWLPSRETYADFIANIADHGYAGDNSIMSHGVTDQGVLHYKDLQPLATSGAIVTVFTGAPDAVSSGNIPMVGYEIIGMDGLNNFLGNYGLKQVQEKLTGLAQLFNSYDATMFSQFSAISSAVQSALDGLDVRSEFLPHEMGNQHSNYYNAEYNNRRGRQLFSCRAEFVTMNCSGINLYDVVNFQPLSVVTNQIATLWAGNYICAAKTKFLSRSNYVEKLQILSSGFGANPGGFLVDK